MLLYFGAIPSADRTVTNAVVYLKVDGSQQSSIKGFGGAVAAHAMQADSEILLGGFFTQVNGTPKNRLVHLNTDGSIDTPFDIVQTGISMRPSIPVRAWTILFYGPQCPHFYRLKRL